jgi:LytS/YehU family sensor histidine kinase
VRSYRWHQQVKLDEARLLAAAREAQLRALEAQLNPHFLFNSLNSLRALLPLELERPREAVTQLADLLRASLTSAQEKLVPLAGELETVEKYLALEHLRHENRLRWRIDANADAGNQLVPPFLVQGLIENAIKHGVDRLEAGGEIVVAARVEHGTLRITVTNPGSLEKPTGAASTSQTKSTGVGLANARARLALLFGPEARLTLQSDGFARVIAEVFIPARPTSPPNVS